MERGKVRFYNVDKGFGFLISDPGQDQFFHISRVVGRVELQGGDLVEFETEMNPSKGKTQGTAVRLLERAEEPYNAEKYGRAFFERDNGGGW